jgi:hypothetical protein
MSFYIVTHHHRYGSDSHLVVSDTLPTERQVVRELHLNFEPSKQETIDIDLLSDEEYRNPKMLERREDDDEEFDELTSNEDDE